MRYASRLVLLALGVCITTLGLLYWQHRGFDFEGIWFHDDDGFRLHPLHLVALGLAVVPPTIWEIFVLELKHRLATTPETAPTRARETEPSPAAPPGEWRPASQIGEGGQS